MKDIFTIALAIAIVVAVARWGRSVRSVTVFLLALLTGAWLWANLRASGWQEVFNEGTPEGLSPFTKAMFWRGWPLAPVMLCFIHGNRLRPSGLEGLALVFNWLVLVLILALVRLVCERYFRRRDGRRKQKEERGAEKTAMVVSGR